MPPPSDDPYPADPTVARDEEPSAGRTTTRVAPAHATANAPQPPRRGGAPLPIAATVAALWASVLGLAPVIVLSLIGGIGTGAPLKAVFRVATGAWLLGHGVPVGLPSDRITLVPLGITAWVGWRLVRGGVHAARATGAHRLASPWPAIRAGICVALVYAVIGAIAAGLARTADAVVSPGRAAVAFGLFAAVAGVGGALGYGRPGRRLVRRMPRVLTDAVRAGVAAVAFLLAAGAAAAGLALALSGGAAAQMLRAYQAGLAGQIGITALCLIYLPNLAVWAAAYLLGPGFAVGAGTVVSPEDVLLGPVPAMPVLAALPHAPLTGLGPTLLGAPFVAGLLAGVLLGRVPAPASAAQPAPTWPGLLGSAALAGPIAGVLVYAAMVAARGGLGSGRLADLGPGGIRAALLAAGVVGVGTVVGAGARRSLSRAHG